MTETVNFNFLKPIKGIATKTFSKTDSGWELKSNYKSGKYFQGYEIPVSNIRDAFEILEENQMAPVFMIHGAIIDGTDKKRMIRRKRSDHEDGLPPTIADRNVTIFCFDIDGYHFTEEEKEWMIANRKKQPEAFIHFHLPEQFTECDYIYQYSSSYGLTSKEFKCHLFFWLEKPVHITELKNWAKEYNRIKEWGNIIDHSVLNSAQPVYIQKRICEDGDDPITDFIGLVEKGGKLNWVPLDPGSCGSKTKNLNLNSNRKYDLAAGVEKILTSENYHEELNSLALSLLNQKVPAKTVQKMLEGAMNAAKRSVTDKQRLKDWQDRFDDIGRSVQTAVEIVGNITLDQVLEWIAKSNIEEVKMGFAQKIINLSPVDKTLAIEEIVEKTGFKISAVKKTLRDAENEAADEKAQRMREQQSEKRQADGMYEMELTPENSKDMIRVANKILAQSEKDPRVFKMGSSLVSIGFDDPKSIRQCCQKYELGDDYPAMPIVVRYGKPYSTLMFRLNEDIVFVNEKGIAVEPTRKFLDAIGEANSNEYKSLTGIVVAPFVNKDWKIINQTGYDDETGVFAYMHRKLKINKMDPKKAYDYLAYEVLDEFPFASELDRAVAVSAFMTGIQRPSLSGDSGFPGYGIVSPTQSSGKTTLAQLISYSIFNRQVAATSLSEDESELQKHLLAILQEGRSCILFDNIKQGKEVTSDVLGKIMTTDVYSGRQLGENKNVEVPSSVLWLFTGNGISFVGDFATRVFPININPKMEDPDTRSFKREDIGRWAMDNRKKIISAILSLIMAGKNLKPEEESTRFDKWNKFVRMPILHVAGIDIMEAKKNNQTIDPEKMIRRNLLIQLHEQFGEDRFTTKDMIKAAFGSFEAGETELGDSLIDIAGDKAKNTKSVGRFLAAMSGAVYGELIINRYKSATIQWTVSKVQEHEQEKL